MAVFHNNSIVKTGLSLMYDVANPKSFAGDATTNLIQNGDFSQGTTNWSVYTVTPAVVTNTTVTVVDVPRTPGVSRLVLQCNTSATLGGGGNYGGTVQNGFSTVLSAGVTYTMTYYARSLSGSMNMKVSHQSGSGDESNLSHANTITGNWVKYTKTVTLDLVKPIIYFYNQTVAVGGVPGGIFQIADVQIEAKSYATRYTTGTRGTSIVDLSITGNTGNLVNGPVSNESGGGCLVFDGIDDYVDLGNSIQLSNNFTLSVWVKDGSLSGTFILDQGDLGTDVNNRLEWVNCGLTLSSNNTNSVSATGTINTAVWNNVVVTFAGGVTKFYINGVLDTTTTFIIPTVTSFAPGGSILKIGRRAFNTTAIFSGKIAAIKIYSSTVLTATEIQQNYYALKGRFGL